MWGGAPFFITAESGPSFSSIETLATTYPVNLSFPSCCEHNGEMIIAGGYVTEGVVTNATNKIGVDDTSWSSLAPLPTDRQRYHAAFCKSPTAFYVLNGLQNTTGLRTGTVSKYTFDTNTWSDLSTSGMVHTYGNAATYENGLIYLTGGYDPYDVMFNTLRAYNPVAQYGTVLSYYADAAQRALHVMAALDGYVYVALGISSTGSFLTSIYRWSIVGGSWEYYGESAIAKRNVGWCQDGEYLYCYGGLNSSLERTAELWRWHIPTNKWQMLANFIGYERYGSAVALLADGLHVVAGPSLAGSNNTHLLIT